MPDVLPSLKAIEVVNALKKCGFIEVRQRGSHLILYNNATARRVVVPVHHGKDIKKPLLKKIIEVEAKMTIEEFLGVL